MKVNKIISGGLGVFGGFILFLIFIDLLSKPDSAPLALKPIESLKTYFFGFAFSMGTLGWVLGSLLLAGYLILFYLIGIWANKALLKKWPCNQG